MSLKATRISRYHARMDRDLLLAISGVDHPFDFPDETRKISGGEIIEY